MDIFFFFYLFPLDILHRGSKVMKSSPSVRRGVKSDWRGLLWSLPQRFQVVEQQQTRRCLLARSFSSPALASPPPSSLSPFLLSLFFNSFIVHFFFFLVSLYILLPESHYHPHHSFSWIFSLSFSLTSSSFSFSSSFSSSSACTRRSEKKKWSSVSQSAVTWNTRYTPPPPLKKKIKQYHVWVYNVTTISIRHRE